MGFERRGDFGAEIPVYVDGEKVYDLRGLTDDLTGLFWEEDGVARTRAAVAAGELPELEGAAEMRVGAPIAAPTKILCIGLNYSDHAAESGMAIPAEPVLFMKDPSTIVGPSDDILIPRKSTKTDWEVELGVVIGTTARYLESEDDVDDVIAGYVLSHDVSEREFQLERGGQWDKGKSCETFNPLGPTVVPGDELGDPQNLGLRLWVDDVLRQDGTTANMIFSIRHIIWYLSQFMVLRPGDLINTGTPAGVALGIEGQPYLRSGSIVRLEIDGLGSMQQRTVDA
ncbi:fumarylacetoacetate hydrolase family protein [Microbacterium sediminicola]|uniref:Fumarylacetoacetate hydrolase family protein n=1 Tax=Microbacterium sediminicola TaxID=415210 RepID=A0ABN2IDU0_9MICO